MKKEIIEALYNILSTTIPIGRFFYKRCLGFRSEIELDVFLQKNNFKTLHGGQFLFRAQSNFKHQLVYVTIANDNKDKYIELYTIIKKLPIVKRLFFISYSNFDEWNTTEFTIKENNRTKDIPIPQPNFEYFEFDGKTFVKRAEADIKENFEKKSVRFAKTKTNKLEYLKSYPEEHICNIYANRFFLDVTLRDRKKGMIDLDDILINKNNYILLESKEKDSASTEGGQRYFGWDSRRFAWYLYLKMILGLHALYVVREVDNQESRNFVAWRYIDIDEFAESASWLSESGGGGGAGTITAPTDVFHSLEKLKL